MSFSSRAFCYLLVTEPASKDLSAKSTPKERTAILGGKDGVLDRIAHNLGYFNHKEYLHVDHNWCDNMPDNNGWQIDVFIEHENNIRSANEEVLKLMHLGLGQKVLISFAGENSFENYRKEFGDLISHLHGIPMMQSLTLVICDLENEKGTF